MSSLSPSGTVMLSLLLSNQGDVFFFFFFSRRKKDSKKNVFRPVIVCQLFSIHPHISEQLNIKWDKFDYVNFWDTVSYLLPPPIHISVYEALTP